MSSTAHCSAHGTTRRPVTMARSAASTSSGVPVMPSRRPGCSGTRYDEHSSSPTGTSAGYRRGSPLADSVSVSRSTIVSSRHQRPPCSDRNGQAASIRGCPRRNSTPSGPARTRRTSNAPSPFFADRERRRFATSIQSRIGAAAYGSIAVPIDAIRGGGGIGCSPPRRVALPRRRRTRTRRAIAQTVTTPSPMSASSERRAPPSEAGVDKPFLRCACEGTLRRHPPRRRAGSSILAPSGCRAPKFKVAISGQSSAHPLTRSANSGRHSPATRASVIARHPRIGTRRRCCHSARVQHARAG